MTSETYTRRHLPHWYVPGAVHFVTFRLAGAIPVHVLEALREDRARSLELDQAKDHDASYSATKAHGRFFERYDAYVDTHRDVAFLAVPEVAAMVRASLYHRHRTVFGLIAYCIMPNHVHALFQPLGEHAPHRGDRRPACHEPDASPAERRDEQSPLARIMQGLKSFTAHEANRILQRRGQFWQSESYDHWVRLDESLERIVDYINWNPVSAGRVKERHEWLWGSAHDRYVHDGSLSGLVALPE
ncbi:hypothetical protein HQ560_22475 [bacterium]|nr:hypothetical protein [bacterium]